MVSGYTDDEISLEIKENNIFVNDGVFQESGILEHIAQSVIIYFAKKNRKISTTPKIGKISDVSFVKNVLVNDVIETRIEVLYSDDDVIEIVASTEKNKEVVATCQMLLIL